jgi:hypothetical protein
MSRKCPECRESGDRPHLPTCSYAPNIQEREAFIKEHAVELVRGLEEKVRRQARQLNSLGNRICRQRTLIRQLTGGKE